MPSIVLELQQESLDASVPVTNLLRKALVVATKLELTEFNDWVVAELNGYTKTTAVPAYRNVEGQLEALHPAGGWIPVILPDPEEAKTASTRSVGESVPRLEDTIANASQDRYFLMKVHPEVQAAFQRSKRVDWPLQLRVSRAEVVGIVNAARDFVLKWMLQLEREGILGEGVTFTIAEKATAQSSHSTVNNFYGTISQSQIVQHSPNASVVVHNSPSIDDWFAFVEKARTSLEHLELDGDARREFEVDLQTIELQAKLPNPKWGIIREAGMSLQRILEGAVGGAVGGAATPALLEALRHLLGF